MKCAFVFPGQGAQSPGMGKELYDNVAVSKDIFTRADEILGYSITDRIFNGDAAELKKTEITQPAVFTVSAAVLAAVKEKLPSLEPVFTAGHSLGEYAAVYASGALDFESALKLVAERGRILSKIKGGTMAAVMGLSDDKVKEVCSSVSGVCEAVNFNSPGQVVIAGDFEAIKQACEAAKTAGAKRALPLAVSGPFHSSLMRPARDEFAAYIEGVNFSEAAVPVVANTIAKPVSKPDEIKQALREQVSSPVLWTDSVAFMTGQGVDTFIELGPGRVLSGLIKRANRDAKCVGISDAATLEAAVKELS